MDENSEKRRKLTSSALSVNNKFLSIRNYGKKFGPNLAGDTLGESGRSGLAPINASEF